MNLSVNNINFCGTNPNNVITKEVKKTASVLNSTYSPNNAKGQLSELGCNLILDIQDLFKNAHSLIKSIAKSANTRSSVKNGYPGIKRGIAGSKILEFEKIGANGEDVAVNFRVEHRNSPRTVIFIGGKQLVINGKGQIEKNPTLQFIGKTLERGKGETLKFFSQKEIDELNIENYLFLLKQELKKYLDYIVSRKKTIDAIREKQADNIPGSLDEYKPLIDDITEDFKYFKANLERLSYKGNDKNFFRIFNKIKTIQRNAILFKDATTDGRSLYLVFSKVKFKDMIKICLMDYNNKTVDKSFIIFENKLVKFNPKTVTQRPKHPENGFHYYTQEEIDNTELDTYLSIIGDRLEDINEKLRTGIKERFSKE